MFDYLADKIAAAPLAGAPFRHVAVEDFLSPEHFAAIVAAPEIALHAATDDRALVAALRGVGYKAISFPGTTTDVEAYLRWHGERTAAPDKSSTERDLCEGVGVTMRLLEPRSEILTALIAFLSSERWLDTIAARFGIDRPATRADSGIQKYLDGYEISPHPDVRAKALTYMVNINPAPRSAELDYHTHYMRFTEPYRYVESFWRTNPDLDRCWVPWSWCETVSRQTRNNSLVMFQPADDTLHAVKAGYDHLATQRTQLYGNLWYNLPKGRKTKPSWRDLDIRSRMAIA